RTKLWISLAILVLPPAAGELWARLSIDPAERATLERFRAYLRTGAVSQFAPRAYTNYQYRPGAQGINSFGFSDVEWKRERTPGVPRLVCLGSATTESGNGEGRIGSYPRQLELELERRTGRNFEVFNAGIASWTSAEELVSWFLALQDLRPDVLVLHEAAG